MEGAGVEPPTLVIVGEVVRLRGKLDWFRTGAAGDGGGGPPPRAHATLAHTGVGAGSESASEPEAEPAPPAGDTGEAE